MIGNIGHKYDSLALTLLRVIAGFLFVPHGAQKLFGMFGGMGGTGAVAAFPALTWFAGVCEFYGGLLLLLGIFTRPVAFLLCGQMAVAYFKAHAPNGFWPLVNRGELAVLYCFVFLYLAVAGGGRYRLESLWHRRAKE